MRAPLRPPLSTGLAAGSRAAPRAGSRAAPGAGAGAAPAGLRAAAASPGGPRAAAGASAAPPGGAAAGAAGALFAEGVRGRRPSCWSTRSCAERGGP